MLDRRPPQQYAEANDMTLYRRKDGQRLFIWEPNEIFNSVYTMNIVRNYHAQLFVDYIICSNEHTELHRLARYLGIPILDYECNEREQETFHRFLVQVDSANPTRAIIFQGQEVKDFDLSMWDYCFQNNIPAEGVRIP